MNDLSREEKLKLALELIEKHQISAYEISKNVDISDVGAGKIISGASKKPRQSTINAILDYIKEKYNTSAEINGVRETEPVYKESVLKAIKNLEKMIRRDNDVMFSAMNHTLLNTEELKDNNLAFSKSLNIILKTLNSISRKS